MRGLPKNPSHRVRVRCLSGLHIIQFDLSRGGIWGVGIWLRVVCVYNLDLEAYVSIIEAAGGQRGTNIVVVIF